MELRPILSAMLRNKTGAILVTVNTSLRAREIEYLLHQSETSTLITIRGVDKHLVGQTAAQMRALRPPDPYKGKGVRYAGEVVRKKVGKAGAK